MGDIFRQLGQLFLQSVPTVVFVFLLFLILNRILFRPLIAVLKKREEATSGALARARQEAEAVVAKTQEYEAAFQSARQEVYRQREADRRVCVAEREAALQKARGQAEELVREGQALLDQEVAVAKVELERTSRPLAEEISQSLLGPDTFTGGAEGVR
jgi:F-type H+-transporting ATPase subunit b